MKKPKSLIKKRRIQAPPGQLTYTGEFKSEQFRTEVYKYTHEAIDFETTKDINRLIELIKNAEETEGVLWLNIIGLNNIESIRAIGDSLHISKLYLEDILHVSKHSKYNVTSEYVFSVMQMIYQRDEHLLHERVSIYMDDNVILTFQETAGDVFEDLRERIRNKTGIVREKDASYLFYCLMDALVDGYIGVVDDLNIMIDDLEEVIVEEEPLEMGEVYWIKKQLLLLKTTLFPLRNIVPDLKNIGGKYIKTETSAYYEDLREHIEQVTNDTVTLRERINQVFETNMLNVSNDMNEVMTTLTIFSAIFIPLSFLSGVFGMNFTHMPFLDYEYGFEIFMTLCAVSVVAMLIFFKRRKWY